MVGGRHAHPAVAGTRRRGRMQHSRVRWILLCCVIGAAGLVLLFTMRGLRIRHLRDQLSLAQETYEQCWIDRESLEAQLALQDDLPTIEDEARKKLGWVLPGEERVIFIDPTTDSSHEGD